MSNILDVEIARLKAAEEELLSAATLIGQAIRRMAVVTSGLHRTRSALEAIIEAKGKE